MSPDPAYTTVGLMPVTVGIAALTLNVCAVDAPPVVPGVFTVTGTAAAEDKSEAGMAAFNCVLSRYVVTRGVPFQLTTEFALYPVPVMVM
jgi:hypothetical protein